jgi:serine/threonine-protein kinase
VNGRTPPVRRPVTPAPAGPVKDPGKVQFNLMMSSIGLVVVAGLMASASPGLAAEQTNQSTGGATVTGSQYVTETPDTTSTTVTTTTPPPDPEADAKAQLDAEVAKDRTAADALDGQWTPQLSSKSYGLVVGATTYNYQAIWQDFATSRARFPAAILVWSGDYTSFDYHNFWVTVVPPADAAGVAANSWCDAQNIDADDCFAKMLMHSGGTAGTTLHR